VLTFNYDQAFEIAFLDRFKNADQYLLYGQMALNSGLNLNGIGFEPGAFSFLKLHGSVGMWITDFPGDPIYQQRPRLIEIRLRSMITSSLRKRRPAKE
jgi:hypothetical protein